jgi:hypothetical protein
MRWRVAQGAFPLPDADISDRVLWLAEELHRYRDASPKAAVVDADDVPDPHHGAKHPAVLNALFEAAEQLGQLLSGHALR